MQEIGESFQKNGNGANGSAPFGATVIVVAFRSVGSNVTVETVPEVTAVPVSETGVPVHPVNVLAVHEWGLTP